MTNWGDYAITAVRYNDEETRIQKVQRREVNFEEEYLGEAEEKARITIVIGIEVGIEYTTAVESSDGNWDLGEEVHVIEVDGSKFIRTDQNDEASDNLADLPRF